MVHITPLDVSAHSQFDHHEEVVRCTDAESGLDAIIAIHNSNLGPALGGCRVYPFASLDDALTDALRLSRGMTYKSALAGLPLGGGKSVILANPHTQKTPAMMDAFGQALEMLGGRYVTAEDVGSNEQDMITIARRTRYVSGLPPESAFGQTLVSGNPSPVTAKGVYHGLKAAAGFRYGHNDLSGRTIAIQGLGSVGYALASMLYRDGANLVIADVNTTTLDRAMSQFGDRARIVDVSQIHAAQADIFAPCALGAGINALTIPQIKAQIIAGAANNQLATPQDDIRLLQAGITYVPDYVINAGGIMSVALEYYGRNPSPVMNGALDDKRLDGMVSQIGQTVATILGTASRNNAPTGQTADALARDVFLTAMSPRRSFAG